MIPLATPNLSGNEGRYLQECIESTFVSSVGPFVDRFESLVAQAAGAGAAVATSSGTTGLHAALVAVGVGPGDLVLLPTLTFIASANAIHQAGATPWLVDVSADSWTLDPAALERALHAATEKRGDHLVHRESGRRVAATMPVHALGMPADMGPIVELAHTVGLPVVADAAAALGARYRGRPPAALGADLDVFSFNGNKTVTAGGGGAVTGSDEALCARVRHLTTTARSGADYEHDEPGFNYRMTNLQAAVGCAQLEQLDAFVAAKRRVAARYDAALTELPGVSAFPSPAWAESACWFSGVRVDSRPVPELVEALRARDVEARPFWRPMHLQKPYRDAPREPTPVADAVWSEVLTLPCSTHLGDADQERVIEAVRECLSG